MRDSSSSAPAGGQPVAARPLSRRRVLVVGAVAAAGALVGRPGRAAAAEPAGGGPAWLRRSTHAPLVGTRYTARTAAGAVGLVLVNIDDLRGRTPAGDPLAGRDDAFVLVLQGPSGLGQGVHRLDHRGTGPFDALVAPGPADAGGTRYAVVVNRTAGAG